MSELALFGGRATMTEPLGRYRSLGREEAAAAKAVIEDGVLSQFLGCWHPDFYGGPKVQEFERAWESHFRVAHAVTVNSNTSGLIAALGAIGLEPGDEVIVSPWTMSASATAILVWNAIPVFADIEEDTYNLDPASIAKNITPQTKAVVVTDIFGHSADMDAIMTLARAHGLRVVEDAAQAPGARYHDRFVGTLADIGVFSLNYHKHIHTGEGGVCVTDDPVLAERMQLIRNHAEAVVEEKGVSNLSNMIGFNFRMTEIQAAIGIEQLRKLSTLIEGRVAAANSITRGVTGLPGLRPPVVKDGCTHVYYVYPLRYDASVTGVSRDRIVDALRAEGVPVSGKYVNVHLLPMYQRRMAYGTRGFPWSAPFCRRQVPYAKGICPVAEAQQDGAYIGLGLCEYEASVRETRLVVQAFEKVWRHLPELATVQDTRTAVAEG
jgi:perosamine synthetase